MSPNTLKLTQYRCYSDSGWMNTSCCLSNGCDTTVQHNVRRIYHDATPVIHNCLTAKALRIYSAWRHAHVRAIRDMLCVHMLWFLGLWHYLRVRTELQPQASLRLPVRVSKHLLISLDTCLSPSTAEHSLNDDVRRRICRNLHLGVFDSVTLKLFSPSVSFFICTTHTVLHT